ncbi:PepSY-associated TM helix domain-containing protein [Saccharopolyspora mangrovi]|uniref:PepSY-associated TM helix domain-containing protein n=1 Tax=Saccharopolyspora mangrovi TaxID=3082379 RepID=A0ABU6AAK4_9PSEU|nr:PepSY-associated TM helix domain-containing protein [Saccharopolyspora sp. S2-29]MEB3368603.1 PepSY-associated TM helix domain-containing protein [Saccharopolyspora sp. S2-29]
MSTEATPATEQRGGTAGTWAALRPLVMRLHFYAGLLIAPFLVVAASTGLLYVFTPQLEQLVYDRELHVPASPRAVSVDDQLAVARAAQPGASLMSIRPAATPTDTTQVIFAAPDLPESFRRTVFVDPHTAEVRGILETYGSNQALPLRAWIDNLHRGLHLGEFGRLYSELAASWLWVVALGGLLLWFRRRRSSRKNLLVPETGATGRKRLLSWHGALGTWTALGLLFLSATGLTWSAHAGANVTALREALAWETPTVSTSSEHQGHHGHGGHAAHTGADVGPDRVLRAAEAQGVTGPVELTPPTSGGAYVVQQVQRHWPTQQDSVAVDAASGQVTETLRFADWPLMAKLARWGVDAHMGLLFGLVNQLVLAALVVALLTAIVLGYRMWWRRRPAGTFGAPVARGAWRQVPLRVLLPLVAVALAVAFFLPLLGISLLVFVLIDVAVGRWRALR